MELECKRKKILDEKDLSIKLKSRAICPQDGGANTKYFHNFYRNMLTNNTIWQLDKGDGHLVSSFDDLVVVGTNNFSALFKEYKSTSIRDMMDHVALFPTLIMEEQNESL